MIICIYAGLILFWENNKDQQVLELNLEKLLLILEKINES